MIAPLFKTGLMGYPGYMISGLIIGILFGFVLERSGFGSARKLTAVFYLRDFAVPKVMFTAIITAMMGVFYLSALEILDVSKLYFSPTYVLPFIFGGFLFGVGFLIGGYCPGTALVAMVNRKLDAFVFAFGVCFGILFFSWIYKPAQGILTATSMGTITIPQWLNVHPGWVIIGVIIFAFFFMGAANKLESIFGDQTQEENS